MSNLTTLAWMLILLGIAASNPAVHLAQLAVLLAAFSVC